MTKLFEKYNNLIVILWGAILFIPFLGAVHLFDWDEINFAESAREMIISGNFQKVQINFQPFMEKPPLFFWIQAISMKLFGMNEFAARLPNAIIGMITLIFIFNIGKKIFNKKLAIIWVLMITGSLTPHLYFKSGIIDPLYNLLIFSAIFQLYLYSIHKNLKHAVLLGFFIGLAIITKGPVAILVILLCFLTFWAIKKFKLFFKIADILIAALIALIVSAIWFGLETIKSGPSFLFEFIGYQIDLFLNPVAGHGQPFWYHPLVLLLGCFPASVFALIYLFRKTDFENETQSNFYLLMQIMFWVVLILFSIVETKIVHYSSLCYIPLTFIAAVFVIKLSEHKEKLRGIQKLFLLIIGSLLGFLFTVLPLIDHYKNKIIPFIKDEFAVACLQISGNWNGFEWMAGVLFLIAVIISASFIWKDQPNKGIRFLLIFISVFLPVEMYLIAPQIERYSQGPAIDFFESKQDSDCYLETLGYKSYAQYFYGKVKPPVNLNSQKSDWLKNDSIDKNVYFVLHINHVNEYVNDSMIEIGRKGGFVFMERKPVIKP